MKESRGLLRTALLVAVVAIVAVTALALVACGGSGDAATSSPSPSGDILAAAAGEADLSQFVDAVTANGLDSTLAGDGPFTVFAPSNAAIDAATGVTVNADLLKAHVIEGQALTAADLAKGTKNDSMLADNTIVTYTGNDGELYVNSIKVLKKDIVGTNGVVYVIDGMIQPK